MTDTKPSPIAYTIGTARRPWNEFVSILQKEEIETLVDTRSWPRSRRTPQFNKDEMTEALSKAGIRYVWLGKPLGGFQKTDLGNASPNTALKDESFRAYADHMQTSDYRKGVEELITIASEERIAFICAEKDPMECHRSMIADDLVSRGWSVRHLVSNDTTLDHKLRSEARRTDKRLIYDQMD